eukprot:6203431-Pleurochrysis_carterae.AAC.1
MDWSLSAWRRLPAERFCHARRTFLLPSKAWKDRFCAVFCLAFGSQAMRRCGRKVTPCLRRRAVKSAATQPTCRRFRLWLV